MAGNAGFRPYFAGVPACSNTKNSARVQFLWPPPKTGALSLRATGAATGVPFLKNWN